jgi:RNA recognition motif-containing protein
MLDRDTNKSRGFGFITFANVRDAEDAVRFTKEDKLVIDGRPVRADFATPVSVAEREGDGGGGGGGVVDAC